MSILNLAYGKNTPTPITTAGIYRNQNDGLISLSSDGISWMTITDKNLGATQVWNSGDTLTQNNMGNIYQWGNNYGFPSTGTITTTSTRVDASNYGPSNPYSSSTYINVSGDGDWSSVQNDNLWGGGNDDSTNNYGLDTISTTQLDRQFGCASGFHIPCIGEIGKLIKIYSEIRGYTYSGTFPLISIDSDIKQQFISDLLLPLVGIYSNAWYNQGNIGYYWSSSAGGTSARYMFTYTTTKSSNTLPRCNGLPIRPFKNDAVQPDTTRTVLYQPS